MFFYKYFIVGINFQGILLQFIVDLFLPYGFINFFGKERCIKCNVYQDLYVMNIY